MTNKSLSWDELADIYDKETSGYARTRTMNSIYDWAVSRKDIFKINKDRGLCLIKEEKSE